jgi:hypothetical protein
MARKNRPSEAADTVTRVPNTFVEDNLNPYPKYTFYASLFILLIILFVFGYAFVKGGMPVKIR